MRTVLALALLLVACSTPQSRYADNAAGYQEMCARMGYAPGSADMGRCIGNLYSNDEQGASARRQRALAAGLYILQQNQPQPAPPAPTVCRWIGPNWVCQ